MLKTLSKSLGINKPQGMQLLHFTAAIATNVSDVLALCNSLPLCALELACHSQQDP